MIALNDTVTLNEPTEGEWTPAGDYKVTKLHDGLEQGGFSVDGRCTVIWPHRVTAINGKACVFVHDSRTLDFAEAAAER